MNAIFPLAEDCSVASPTSMLEATLNDMLAVNAAFAEMAGMPSSMTSGLKRSMQKIEAMEGSGGKLAQLKSDMTERMANKLAEKLDLMEGESGKVSDVQKSQLCSTFQSIAPGSESKPVLCED